MSNIQLAKPKLLLTSSTFFPKVEEYCKENDVAVWMNDKPGNFVDLVPSNHSDEFSAAPRDPSDLALILWSSGSTGIPKGIKLPYSALINQCLRQWKAPLSNNKDSK